MTGSSRLTVHNRLLTRGQKRKGRSLDWDLMTVLKGKGRGVAGRHGRPLVQPWADLCGAHCGLPSLPGKSPLRCSRQHPGLCSAGRAAPCLPPHLSCEACAWLQAACTPRSPLSLGRRVPALLSGPTLCGHSAPLPLQRLPLPIAWPFCTTSLCRLGTHCLRLAAQPSSCLDFLL